MTVPIQIRRQPISFSFSGRPVILWQQLLRKKGFVVDIDGIFGPRTRSATLVAQHWAGVTADGVVGEKTWKAVEAKKRTRRPVQTARHVLGFRPKILDVRRGQHGFPLHHSRHWGKRTASEIVAKLGHYTGGPASFLADAHFHVETDYLDVGGAPAIAYTLGVDKDGTLYVFNDWTSITWHCDGGHNTDTLGVVFRGAAEGPTRAQQMTLRWLWKQLEAGTFKPFNDENVWPRLVRSTTHRHVNATSCPGDEGEAFYRQASAHFVMAL